MSIDVGAAGGRGSRDSLGNYQSLRGGEWQRHMSNNQALTSMALDAQESVRLADCHNIYIDYT